LESLKAAISKSDATKLEEMLSRDPSLANIKMNEEEWRPIHYAANNGDCKIGKILLKYNSDLSARTKSGSSANDISLCNGTTAFSNLLIQNGYPKDFFSLCGMGNVDEVASTLSKDKSVIEHKIKNGFYPIHVAVINEQLMCLDILLSNGDDIDRPGAGDCTPLHFAVLGGNQEIVNYLLSKGANPDLKDSRGQSPLHFAIIKGRKEIAELLIQYGATKNSIDIYKLKPSDYLDANYKNILRPIQPEN
jgi:ankyrin repeat protein